MLLIFTDLYNFCAANGKKDRGESRQPTTKVHALYGSESEGGKRISKCGCQRLFIRRYISSCKKHLIYFEWPHNISREKKRSTRCHNDEGWRNRVGKVGIFLPIQLWETPSSCEVWGILKSIRNFKNLVCSTLQLLT